MTVVTGNSEVPTVINTPFIPTEGPRDLPLLFDWSLGTTFQLDLQQQVQNGQFSRAQTLFIDNSANTNGPVTIAWHGTGQIIQVPPGWQGYTPVLSTQRPFADVSSTGTGKTSIHVLNIPISPGMWPTTQTTPAFTPGGAMLVSDAALDSVTTSNGVEVVERVTGSGDVVYNVFKSQNALSGMVQGSTGNLLVGAPSLFVNFVDVRVSGDASMGASVVNTTTMNPADQSNQVILGGGNLIVHNSTGGADGGVRAIASDSTALRYFETTWTMVGNSLFTSSGIADAAANLTGGNSKGNNMCVVYEDGAIYVNGVSQGASGGALANGVVVGHAFNATTKKFWARQGAGNWNNNATNNPSTGVGGIDFSAIAAPYFAFNFVGDGSGMTLTNNFGATAFANTAPASFLDIGTTSGGGQGVTVALMEGTRTICQGEVYIGASQTVTTGGITAGSEVIKLDQLNYDAKATGTTLSLSVTGGGIVQSLATGNFIYNIGAGTTAMVN